MENTHTHTQRHTYTNTHTLSQRLERADTLLISQGSGEGSLLQSLGVSPLAEVT